MSADLFGLGPNAGFVVAAYVATALILVGYAVSLWRKSKQGGRP